MSDTDLVTARAKFPGVGALRLSATPRGLREISFVDDDAPGNEACPSPIASTLEQLSGYFAGTRRVFDVRLDLQGTDFQRSVWTALLDIPFGQTRSYADIARAIGNPDAVRAVGLANGRNPVSIIVPCHRVIGSDGSLTGYGGGMDRKRWLLAHEGVEGFATPALFAEVSG
ncbi:MAG: methylated-DNA--[protein]-cysteine S-methyltransferase [Planctomycetota bacterium]